MLRKTLRSLSAFFIIGLISACNNEPLLENLTQEQANQVLAILQQHNISAEKSGTRKEGYAVRVGEYENTAALSIVNQYQLPWAAEIQIGQAFPESALVASPNAEQARVISLLEQRLGQSLRLINQVVNVRVHISYPAFRNDVNNKNSINHVGILVSYKGDINENIFISQIKSLIKNSVNDVSYDNISVVLFDAPAIQYSPPTKVSRSWPIIFMISLASIAFITIVILIIYLYKSRWFNSKSRHPIDHKKDPS